MLRTLAATTILVMATVLSGSRPTSSRAVEPPDPHLPYLLTVGAVAADGLIPAATLSATAVYQGGAFLVTVSEGVSGNVSLFGRTYPLDPIIPGSDGLQGLVGIGTEDPPGATTAVISYLTSYGQQQQLVRDLTVLKTSWTVSYIDLPPDTSALLDPSFTIAEQNRLNAIYSAVTPSRWRLPWASPVKEPLSPANISSYFGEQRSFNGGPVGGHHGGTDIAVDAGTPIFATNDGVVVLAETLKVRGNMVIIDHGGGVFSGYAHMQSIAVSAGDRVTKGQLIGYVGATGLADGPHLHWEMSVGGVLVDGLRWLDFTQGF
jgi:hypothetical protein